MSGRVEEGQVAGEFEVVAGAVGADRLFALPVQVAPVGHQLGFLGEAQRVGAGEQRARVV